MKFGENLYNLRKSASMSQEQLAEKMDVSRQSVSTWENGESYPTINNIMVLCDIFHCKINDLVHENMADIDSLDEDIKMSVVKFKEEKQRKIKGISKAIYIIARIGKIFVTIAIPIIAIQDNEVVFKGTNEKIVVTEENLDNRIALKVKYNGTLVADETDQEIIMKMKEVLEDNSKLTIIAYVEAGMISLFICLILYRMTLNRLEKLFININQGDTPFTLENVKYIKQMAYIMIFALALPTFGGIVFEKIFRLDLDVGFELFDVIQILFLFGIAYIFEYGYELQLDSKGKMYGNENE